jgi:hypothetical protein
MIAVSVARGSLPRMPGLPALRATLVFARYKTIIVDIKGDIG